MSHYRTPFLLFSALPAALCLAGCTWFTPDKPIAAQPATPVKAAPVKAPPLPTGEKKEKVARLITQLNIEQIAPGEDSEAIKRKHPTAGRRSFYKTEFDQHLCAAIDELVALGPDAVPPLRAAVAAKSTDPAIRRNAAVALARLNDPAGSAVLYDAAEDDALPPPVRSEAVASLARLAAAGRGPPLDAARLAALYDQAAKPAEPVRQVQTAIIRAAASSDQPALRDLALKALDDRDPALLYAALETVPALKLSEMPRTVVAALDNPNPRITLAAMHALARAAPALLAPAYDALLANADPDVRVEAARLIADTAPPDSPRLLARALKDKDIDVQRQAVRSLDQLADAPSLEVATDHPRWQIREAAVAALGRLKSAASLPVLAARAHDDAPNVRQALALAVAQIGRPAGATIAADLLSDSSPAVRTAARNAFVQLSGQKLSDFDPDQPTWKNQPAIDRAKAWANHAKGAVAPSPSGEGGPASGPGEGLRPGTSQKSTSPAQSQLDRDIEKLIDGLALPRGETRQLAVAALVRLKDRAIPALEAALANRPPAVVAAILDEVLPVIDPLYMDISNLRLPDDSRRRQAAIQFSSAAKDRRLPAAAVRRVHDALAAESDGLVRRLIIERLLAAGDPELGPALVAGLKLPDAKARQSSALYLGRLKDRAAVPDLIRALDDQRVAVQYAAAWALGEIGDDAAAPALEKALRTRDIPGRLAFGAALARLGATAGRDELVRLLSDTTTATQVETIRAMAAAPDPSFIIPLVERLDPNNLELTGAANDALMKITGQDFGYRPQADRAHNEQALLAWRNWSAARQQLPPPAP
jgi:HEAT repeat protein